MALIEAMACGLSVVASRFDGVTDEIVDDGVTGWLVPPEDAGAMADALARVLDDESAAMGMGARVPGANRYGLEASRERWLELYRAAGMRC